MLKPSEKKNKQDKRLKAVKNTLPLKRLGAVIGSIAKNSKVTELISTLWEVAKDKAKKMAVLHKARRAETVHVITKTKAARLSVGCTGSGMHVGERKGGDPFLCPLSC